MHQTLTAPPDRASVVEALDLFEKIKDMSLDERVMAIQVSNLKLHHAIDELMDECKQNELILNDLEQQIETLYKPCNSL